MQLVLNIHYNCPWVTKDIKFLLINTLPALNQVSHSTSITIYHENPIEIYSTSVNVTVNVGGSYTFFCNASNTILRQWLYRMGPQRPKVLSNTTDGKVITMDFELQLRNITLEDEGIYECLLSNYLGRLYLTNNLSVTGQ